MNARTTPEDGDIVVRQETRNGTRVHVLHTAPGPDQSLLGSREAAVAHARALVAHHHVRAWWTTDDSYDFVLLDNSRDVPGDGLRHERAALPVSLTTGM